MNYTSSPLSIIISSKNQPQSSSFTSTRANAVDGIGNDAFTTQERVYRRDKDGNILVDEKTKEKLFDYQTTSATSNIDANSEVTNFGAYSIKNGYVKSLFNQNVFSVNPNYDSTGRIKSMSTDFYNDTNYNYSYNKLIEWSNEPNNVAMRLRPSDFAFLKQRGVYPPNRLVIVRRFISGVADDLTRVKQEPVSTIVSFIPEDSNFIEAEFGEEWTTAPSSFKELLNDIGNDLTFNSSDNKGGQWGNLLGNFGNLIPMPGGLSENFQYKVLKNLGWTDLDASMIPYGNPNLIREAMMRKTIGNDGGSTLKARIRIEVEVDYEIEYYPNIDPTLAYLDVIANVLSFSTSESVFQLNPTASEDMNKFLSDISSGVPSRIKDSILTFITATAKTVVQVAKDLLEKIAAFTKRAMDKTQELREMANNDASIEDMSKNAAKFAVDEVVTPLINIGADVLQTVINKYKIKLIGVIHSLTGQPSTDWHVTIGNPKKPIFSSGDMYIHNEVEMQWGKTLGFNDLPTSLHVKFTLINARNLGAQEIFRKFNCGKSRTYEKIGRSFIENSSAIKVTKEDAAKVQGKLTVEMVSKQNTDAPDGTAVKTAIDNQTAPNNNSTTDVWKDIEKNLNLKTPFGGSTNTTPFTGFNPL
jgi:hypothetical protein